VHTPALCIKDGLGLISNEVDPVFTGTFGIIIFYRYSSPRITALRFPRSSGVSQIIRRSGQGGFSFNYIQNIAVLNMPVQVKERRD
jgi:hypothetical protein